MTIYHDVIGTYDSGDTFSCCFLGLPDHDEVVDDNMRSFFVYGINLSIT